MTFEQAKNQIEKNEKRIEELTDPTKFVLNKEIYDLIKQNEELKLFCKNLENQKGE